MSGQHPTDDQKVPSTTHRIVARWRRRHVGVVLRHLVPLPDDDLVEEYRLLPRRLDIARVVIGFRRGRGRVDARTKPTNPRLFITLRMSGIHATCLPQPVFLPKRFKLYDVRMMPQSEHDVDEQRVVFPFSPKRHSLVVPCHRRFSFPGDRPAAANLPRASTDVLLVPSKTRRVCRRQSRHSLVRFILGDGSGVSNDLVYAAHGRTRRRVPPRGLELVGNCTPSDLSRAIGRITTTYRS